MRRSAGALRQPYLVPRQISGARYQGCDHGQEIVTHAPAQAHQIHATLQQVMVPGARLLEALRLSTDIQIQACGHGLIP